ncbi:MAG: hypothetical protein ABFE07_06475 [Armatimonadia bacterium]
MSEGESRLAKSLKYLLRYEREPRADSAQQHDPADTIATLTHQLEAERERAERAEAALREQAMQYLALDQQATEAVGRAVKAEEERSRLRMALAEAQQAQKVILEFVSKSHNLIAALKTGEPSHD